MASVTASIDLSGDVSSVWKRIGSFDDPSWVPGTVRCDVEAVDGRRRRTLTTVAGARITEQLVSADDANHRYSYTIVEAPMPIRDYVSVIEASAVTGGTRVTWRCTFEADAGIVDAIQAALDELYRSALQGLEGS